MTSPTYAQSKINEIVITNMYDEDDEDLDNNMKEQQHDIKQSKVSDDTEEDDEYNDEDYAEENSSDGNDDDDDDKLSWKDELIASWQQHTVAIIVACIATFIAYTLHKHILTNNNIDNNMNSHTMMLAPSTLELARRLQYEQQHPHLDHYQRTANVTFCHHDVMQSTSSSSLVFMDFDVPKELITTMDLHYKADMEFDHNYEKVLRDKMSSDRLIPPSHTQYHCMQEQMQYGKRKDFIRGYTFYYQSPSIRSMYQDDDDEKSLIIAASDNENKRKIMPAHLSFTGFAAKFVNLSPKPILLYWDGRDGARSLVGEISPFEAISTATTPGQSFSISPVFDHTIEYDRWILTADDPIMYYEPKNQPLSSTELQLKNIQLLNKEFAKHYQIYAKRPWLAHFPRSFPIHPMWDAKYFGQIHHIPKTDGNDAGHYTLSVVSVTPRVFTIDNFLSVEECDTLIELANHHGMKQSTVYGGSGGSEKQKNLGTRSSFNAWLARDTTTMTDQIYRRAATILQMNESLLNPTLVDDDYQPHFHSMTESLQIIRYKKQQYYTPHHDWVLPKQIHRYQPTRYATILIYLNDNYVGGHTVFPRAVNQHYHDGIRIIPKKGSAVLFYNILPDGNMDDLSQHSSEKVTSGTKYAANLWVWEPMIN